ncbi:MAG: acetyl-CoA carboxylase biotin carboxyl carrier protein [Planctomycetes bacterium]|nr:acetyl-CoA carboxylase biotin carboxyl carrier protein [Planctomycetota bacterium]
MDLDEIRRILELMEANKVVELEYEQGDKRIKLRRSDEHAPAAVAFPPVVASAPPLTVVAPPPTAETAPPARASNIVEFKSPLVGTFYRAPRPDADPYVNVGDEVGPDKVLCVVEAMKMMNEIKAEMHGIVREILVKNGQAVEYGETLFVIEKK